MSPLRQAPSSPASASAPAGGGAATGERARIEREVRQRYAAELARADICESLQIEVRIRAEVARILAGHSAAAENVTAPAGRSG